MIKRAERISQHLFDNSMHFTQIHNHTSIQKLKGMLKIDQMLCLVCIALFSGVLAPMRYIKVAMRKESNDSVIKGI